MNSGRQIDPTRRPRVVVTTDPELDDLNSMLRLLLYANEIRIAGLVYSSSMFHAAGDPSRDIPAHRWPAPDARGHIDQAIDAYDQVWENLRRHDARYPSPATLRALVATGNILGPGDMEFETEGSRLVESALLEGFDGGGLDGGGIDDGREDSEAGDRVFVQAWGGLNTIARALRSIEERARAEGNWDAVYRWIVSRTVITSFGNQDSTYADYIRPVWPEIEHRQVATTVWGYFARRVVVPQDAVYLSAEWTREHVSSMGPIGAAYRVWGDGKQMAAGFDEEDYFGIKGASVDELSALGYDVWCPLQTEGSWISEGDSSNFALLVDNGLRSWESPEHGGWGGRQVHNPDGHHQWTTDLAEDAMPEGMSPMLRRDGTEVNDYHAARWFGPIQRDFAARLRWSVTSEAAESNHHPVVTVEPEVDASAPAGGTVELAVSASDPDGDSVELTAWHYREAGHCSGDARVTLESGALVVTLPEDAKAGETFHVIVEATDDGAPRLTSYARVIVTVA